MDDNNNPNRLDTVLGVQEDKSVGSKIKTYIKKFKGIPENREVRLTARANFNKVDKDLKKQLKKWDRLGKIKEGSPMVNYLFGDRNRVKAVKRIAAEMDATAKKTFARLNSRLNFLQGEDRENKTQYTYGGKWGDVQNTLTNANAAMLEAKYNLDELIATRNELLETKKDYSLLPDESKLTGQILSAQQKLNSLQSTYDKLADNSINGAIGSKKLDVNETNIMDRNRELSKLAAGHYSRTGKQTLFDRLRKEIDATTKRDEAALTDTQAKLNTKKHQKAGYKASLERLKNNAEPSKENSDKIIKLEAKLTDAENEIHRLTDEANKAQRLVDIDKRRKAQFDDYYAKRNEPQDFAQDKNYKTAEFPAKFDAANRQLTRATGGAVDTIDSLTTSKELANASADVEQAKIKVAELKQQLNKLSIDKRKFEETTAQIEIINEQIVKTQAELKQAEKNASDAEKDFANVKQEVKEINKELGLWAGDLKTNPFNAILQSRGGQKINAMIDDMNVKTKRWWQILSKSNVITRIIHRTFTNIRSQISDMFNPLTKLREGFSSWLDRWDNLPWKNTFDVISYNMVTAFEPVFKWISQALIKVAQFFNPLFKKLAGVDLFDKSAWKLEQIKKGMGQLTASFDELHSNNDNPNQFNTIFDTDPSQISPLSPEMLEAAEKFANGFTAVWKGITGFIEKHPIASAVIGGMAAILGPKALGSLLINGVGLVGKGVLKIGKVAWNGIKWLGPKIWDGTKSVISKITNGSTWKPVGTFLKETGAKVGNFFGKELYTVTNKAGAKVGISLSKVLGGTAMTALGTYGAFKIAGEAGKNWQDMGTGMKVASVAGTGLMSTMAGLGAFMLTASGPVGWAVGGAVALGSFVYGMSQVQDGIGSLKKEQKSWAEAQQNLAIANENWNIAMQNSTNALAQLEALERQTGISGEELYKSVQNGILPINQMTSEQLAVYNAYVQTKEAIDQLKQAQADKAKYEKEEAEGMIRTALAARKKKDDYVDAKDAILKAVEEEKISTTEAADYFSRLMGNMKKDARETLLQEIPEDIRAMVEPTQYASGWEKFTTGVSNVWNNLLELDRKFTENTKQIIKDGFENAKNGAIETWENLKTKTGEKWEEIKNSAIGQKVQEIATNTQAKWNELKMNTQQKFQEMAQTANEKWQTTKTSIINKASEIWSNTKTKFEDLKNKAINAWENMRSKTVEKWNGIKDAISSRAKTAFDNAKKWFEGLGKKASEAWQKVKNLFSGNGWKTDADLQVSVNGRTVPSMDVGTNYVPNDGLAYIHKGEAVIPAKYNKPYQPPSSNSNLESTVAAMTQEIANLRALIQGGIPVKGEFKQRGSDLVAVVEKGRNKNGNQPLSNPAYAR